MNPSRKPRKSNRKGCWAMLDSYLNAWGTKWDKPENEQRELASDLLNHGSAFFDTALSPPIQALEALSRKFTDVSFQLHYCELVP